MILSEWAIYYFCYFCGPLANKFGQILSARSDFLSQELLDNLKSLQDKCQPSADYQLHRRKLPKEISAIQKQPLNAGTICVVLKCKYNKKPAVLKVLKTRVSFHLQLSFKILRFVLWFLPNTANKLNKLNYSKLKLI